MLVKAMVKSDNGNGKGKGDKDKEPVIPREGGESPAKKKTK
jgi:hypothetical protein